MLTYLDSNVLVQGATGANRQIQMRALAIITDPNRQFVSSLCSMNRSFAFRRVQIWVDPVDIYDDAYLLACQHALGAMDALHVASATFADAEFVSAEKPTKPRYWAYHKAVSIY